MVSHDLCFTGPSLWPLMIYVYRSFSMASHDLVFYRTFFMISHDLCFTEACLWLIMICDYRPFFVASHDLCFTGPSLWPLKICVLQDLLYGLS